MVWPRGARRARVPHDERTVDLALDCLQTTFVFASSAASAAPASTPPGVDWAQLDLSAVLIAVAALTFAALFAIVRRSLAQSLPEHVLEGVTEPQRRERLEPLLHQVDRLTTSAAVLESTLSLLFAVSMLRIFAEGSSVSWQALTKALVVSVPVLWFTTDALARGVAQRVGDGLLRQWLPAFHTLQWPLEALAWMFEGTRRGILRLLGVHDDPESTRQIFAGLREVIEESEISGRLDESEKEIIGNVMEFRDVDVAAVMTPRTKIEAADVDEGVLAAVRRLGYSGHSRIPVYEGTLDTIIGTISARDLVQVAASGRLEDADLRAILHPAFFVPETKRVRELLAEMRRSKVEIAVVIDEYGGTAGLITVGDIIGEIVGEIPDEYTEEAPARIRQLPGGAAEIDASMHVSEVNEALELDLPEHSDFETLGGFVLAELGRFPKKGDTFQRESTEYSVVEASDRRVLKVRVRKLAVLKAQ